MTQKSNSPLRSLDHDGDLANLLAMRPSERLNPVSLCAAAAKKKNYAVFGIGNNGECLGHEGVTAETAQTSGTANPWTSVCTSCDYPGSERRISSSMTRSECEAACEIDRSCVDEASWS